MTDFASEPPTHEDLEEIAGKISAMHQSLLVVSTVGDGLARVGATVSQLLANLELAVAAQQSSEDARRLDAEKNRQRFWVTIAGIVLANVFVIAISTVVLLGQIDARDASEARAALNRDRQSCATSLLVYWDEKLGNALRLSTEVPAVPRDAPEFNRAVTELNAATSLIGQAKSLCYGEMPNPDPVPR